MAVYDFTGCQCNKLSCERCYPVVGSESDSDSSRLRDQRIINSVDKLNRARGRRRKCVDPQDPRFGRYI